MLVSKTRTSTRAPSPMRGVADDTCKRFAAAEKQEEQEEEKEKQEEEQKQEEKEKEDKSRRKRWSEGRRRRRRMRRKREKEEEEGGEGGNGEGRAAMTKMQRATSDTFKRDISPLTTPATVRHSSEKSIMKKTGDTHRRHMRRHR